MNSNPVRGELTEWTERVSYTADGVLAMLTITADGQATIDVSGEI